MTDDKPTGPHGERSEKLDPLRGPLKNYRWADGSTVWIVEWDGAWAGRHIESVWPDEESAQAEVDTLLQDLAVAQGRAEADTTGMGYIITGWVIGKPSLNRLIRKPVGRGPQRP